MGPLTSTTTPGQSGSESNGSEGYYTFPNSQDVEPLHYMQFSVVNKTLVWRGSYFSAEMQLDYTSAPANWALSIYLLIDYFKIIFNFFFVRWIYHWFHKYLHGIRFLSEFCLLSKFLFLLRMSLEEFLLARLIHTHTQTHTHTHTYIYAYIYIYRERERMRERERERVRSGRRGKASKTSSNYVFDLTIPILISIFFIYCLFLDYF